MESKLVQWVYPPESRARQTLAELIAYTLVTWCIGLTVSSVNHVSEDALDGLGSQSRNAMVHNGRCGEVATHRRLAYILCSCLAMLMFILHVMNAHISTVLARRANVTSIRAVVSQSCVKGGG
jgi:hypothetical protein